MITELMTLKALYKHKTMGKAATSLHISQSTVSKRIQSLEYQTSKELIEKNGRFVELTEQGLALLEKAEPLLISLREIVEEDFEGSENISVGFSESILSSWGANILGDFQKKYPLVEVEPHAHRSPVIVDKVSSGEFKFAIVAGLTDQRPGVYFEEIGLEEMVIVGPKDKYLFCVERSSGTWRAIEKEVFKKGINIERRSEFFFPIGHLAKQGFCQAFIPKGVALSVGFTKREMKKTGVFRPLYGVGRKSVLHRQSIKDLMGFFKKSIRKL